MISPAMMERAGGQPRTKPVALAMDTASATSGAPETTSLFSLATDASGVMPGAVSGAGETTPAWDDEFDPAAPGAQFEGALLTAPELAASGQFLSQLLTQQESVTHGAPDAGATANATAPVTVNSLANARLPQAALAADAVPDTTTQGSASDVPSAMLRQQLAAASRLSGLELDARSFASSAATAAQTAMPFLAEQSGLRRAVAVRELAATASSTTTTAASSAAAPITPLAAALTQALRAQFAERVPALDGTGLAGARRDAGEGSAMTAPLLDLGSSHTTLRSAQANGAALATADGPEQKLLQVLGERISMQAQQGAQRAVIRLDPHLAGSVMIELRHEAGSVQVHLSATNSDVVRQLQTISEGLRQELGNRQFNDVTVQVSSARSGQHEGNGQGRDAREQAREQRADEPGQGLAAASLPNAQFTLPS